MAQAQAAHKTPSPPQPPSPITLDEYMDLISEEAYEVIDGELIAMSPQHFQSTLVAHALFHSLYPHVASRKLGEVLMETVFALEVDEPSRWLRGSLVPDVAYISKQRLKEHYQKYSKESGVRVAPDLVVEVISPSDHFSSVMKKVKRYLKYGVRLVIVVDVENRVVHVFTPDRPDGQTLDETAILTGAPVLPEWSISIKELLDTKLEID